MFIQLLILKKLLLPINCFYIIHFNLFNFISHVTYVYACDCIIFSCILSPSRRREAPCEGTNSPRLFTPGKTKALAKSKVHQISRASPTNLSGWSSSLISKIWLIACGSGISKISMLKDILWEWDKQDFNVKRHIFALNFVALTFCLKT